MDETETNRMVWCIEAGEEGDLIEMFLDIQNPIIGISYSKDSSSYDRFVNDARCKDLVWLVPRSERAGRAGIIVSDAYFEQEYPAQRRKVKWMARNLFLDKEPFVPPALVRYSKVSITGSFARMHNKAAIDEVRKLCELNPLDELYSEEDLIYNFRDYLQKKFPSENIIERILIKLWLEEMGYRVELPESKINPAWDMKVFKRGVGTFLVQVKHTADIKEKNIKELIEEAESQGIESWWISLGLVDSKRKEELENQYDSLEIWDVENIYSEFISSYDSYSRRFQDIIPMRWTLIPI